MILKPGKIMFIDSVHPILEQRLQSMGFECVDFTNKDIEEINTYMPNYQGVVIRSKFPFDQKIMEKAKKLQFIARSGSGLENIDLIFAKHKNIICFNSPEGNKDAVAEHCIAMLLSLFNKIIHSNLEVKRGIWRREANRGLEIKGKTLGILGYGTMGKTFAKVLKGFGVNVIAYDNTKTNYSSDLVKEVSLEEFYEKTEILSIHINYTEENYHLVNKKYLENFKNNIFLINTSRGKVLHTLDLIELLSSEKILGACLDVLEIESSSFQKENNKQDNLILEKLSQFEQVILSPHVAGWTVESYFKLSNVLADKIQSHFQL